MQESERVWRKSWPPDVPQTLNVDENVSTLFKQSARLRPDGIAISFYGNDYTYSFVDEQVDRFAQALIGQGLAPGDRVGLFLQNSPQFVIGYLGTLRAGGVVVCLNPMFKKAELEYELTDAGCHMLLVSDSLYPEVARLEGEAVPERIIVTWLGEYCPGHEGFDPPEEVLKRQPAASGVLDLQELLNQAPSGPPDRPIGLDNLALLQYTGGTTGLPKGAMISHHALAAASIGMNQWFGNREEDVFLGAAPFFHIMGMVSMLCCPLLVGGRLVIQSRFTPQDAAQAITHYRVSAWVGATTMLVALLGMPDLTPYDFGSLRFICTGGAPIGVELQQKISKLAPRAEILEGYGLTESVAHGGAITPRGGYRPGFVGVPHLNDLRIVDLADRTTTLGPGQEGEIAVKGPAVFMGYWKRPQETDEVIREGWVYTGDVGVLDEEGYLRLLGRQRELIKCSGFSVFPAEVEDLLYRHPAVGEVAVIGVPDDYRGESPKAYVVVKPEFAGKVDESEIVQWAKENMSAYKRPREVAFCEALPKSGAGKILRRVLKEWEQAS